MIRIANGKGWLQGFNAQTVRLDALEVTRILYADDPSVLCEPAEIQIRHLRAILTIFKGISRLQYEMEK